MLKLLLMSLYFLVPFSQPANEHYFSAQLYYQLITLCSLLSPAQILAELQWDTRPSTQDVPLHDPGAVGSVSVPLDPAGKVSSYLFSPVVQLEQHNLFGL